MLSQENPSTCHIATVSQQVSQQIQTTINGSTISSPIIVHQSDQNLPTPTGDPASPMVTQSATVECCSSPNPNIASISPNQIQKAQLPQPPQPNSASSLVVVASPAAASSAPGNSTPNPHAQVRSRKETLEAKRERKAAKTLAIITGAFVVCWLPFFLMALLLPLCGDECEINDKIASFFLWLGYFNSTLNPVIYTVFSPEFRQAFKRLLCGHHRGGYYRGGKL